MSGRAYKQAFLAHLRGVESLPVYDGVLPREDLIPERYALVFSKTPDSTPGSLTGPQSDKEAVFIVHSVGRTPDQAQWVADKVEGRMDNARLTIEGRNSSPVKLTDSELMRRDYSTTPGVCFYPDTYKWKSTPK